MNGSVQTRSGTMRILARMTLCVWSALLVRGCILYEPVCLLTVRGALTDGDSGSPLTGAGVGLGTFTDGRGTAGLTPTTSDGTIVNRTGESGEFELKLGQWPKACPPGRFTPPDEIEITVIRDVCEVVFRVPVNAETVLNPDTSDGMLEFREPISVPPCGQ